MWQRLLDFLSIKRVEIKLIPGIRLSLSPDSLVLLLILPVRSFFLSATIKASIHDMQ